MTVFSSADYRSVLLMSQDEFAELQKAVTALYEEEKYVENVVDGDFIERLYKAIEGEGRSPSL